MESSLEMSSFTPSRLPWPVDRSRAGWAAAVVAMARVVATATNSVSDLRMLEPFTYLGCVTFQQAGDLRPLANTRSLATETYRSLGIRRAAVGSAGDQQDPYRPMGQR